MQTDKYYSEMIPTLSERACNGALSLFGFRNNALRAYLKHSFLQPLGRQGNFIGDPTFEAVFGWKTAEKRIEALKGDLLHPKLIEALDDEKSELKKEFFPYIHQLTAWNILHQEDPQSAIISSGTGSGKTECFMIPILNHLIREWDATIEEKDKQLTGVRTLFLYPLNALINSQRERLLAWTKPFGGHIRFALYNGLTPERLPAGYIKEHPSEVMDRETLRSSPPPILVTNPTMLEYMLVRNIDKPIIEQSYGKLDTIVMDEAHTYIGSQAAEMALLLRRVLHAFGRTPDQVRFIATSATIGDKGEEARKQLKDFMQDLSGVEKRKIHVIEGHRDIPSIPYTEPRSHTLQELQATVSPEQLYDHLCSDATALKIRAAFTEDPQTVATLSKVCSVLFPGLTDFQENQQVEALEWLDVLTSAINHSGQAFLPVRAHIFQNTFAGLWACIDTDCAYKHPLLKKPEWNFGNVHLQKRSKCDCGSPIYEIVSCKECGDVFLSINITSDMRVVQPDSDIIIDEFELDDDDDDVGLDNDEGAGPYGHSSTALIVNKSIETTGEAFIGEDDKLYYEQMGPDDYQVHIAEKGPDDINGLACPSCRDSSKVKYTRFRKHIIGAPYQLGVMLPTLLEYAQEKDEDTSKPSNGRRLLTFNDSRQGTARIAVKLQQDSERNKARGLIYHHVLQEGVNSDPAEIERIKKQIQALKDNNATNDATINDIINELEDRLQEALEFKSVSYGDLKQAISRQEGDYHYICNQYQRHASQLFDEQNKHFLVAELMIFREFARRPRRQNNLETLGLIGTVYPNLDSIRTNPDEWSNRGLNTKEWRTFLGICLDFFVRAGGSLEGDDRRLKNWLGLPFYKTYIIEADEEPNSRFQRRWPNVERGIHQSRLIRYLTHILGIDIGTDAGKDTIDNLLRAAWRDLTENTRTLTRSDTGYVLRLENVAFTIPEQLWICPVTNRFLDKTIQSITPYLTKEPIGPMRCKPVVVPRYNQPFGTTSNPFENRIQAREWMNNKDSIKSLRESGHWSLFNDRVIEYMPYYQSAEHSAQVDADTLKRYEGLFKKGLTNILSCSTTMEMGIDIGGVRMVGMNNVPPHPANYLQRAGRSGRRKERRSTTLTLCKQNPHDLTAFENSRWAFDTKLPAPSVSLRSKRIVLRHVNALVLSHFLNHVILGQHENQLKLQTGWFYTNEKNGLPRFRRWLEAKDDANIQHLYKGVRMLIRNTALDGRAMDALFLQVKEEIEIVSQKWLREYHQIKDQQESLEELMQTDRPAAGALKHQLNRLEKEYLLRELASKGFLPGYGFPSNIVEFNHYNIADYKQARRIAIEDNDEPKTRDDNVFMTRDMPSRDIETALREYAPGADVIIDGAVYRSKGITLNWKVPSSVEDISESQAIRFAWRCGKCGYSDSTYQMQNTRVCENCGDAVGSTNKQEYLEPAGFTVDFKEEKHNDVTRQTFIPLEKPWVQAHGEWKPLMNPALGSFRTTSSGKVFHHSMGIHRKGYALCLMCGRAEPMGANGDLPKNFTPGETHYKLRRSKTDSAICPGNAAGFAIKKGLAFGHLASTDILQLSLKDVDGNWLKNRTVASTLSVVIRDALAEMLGVRSQELSCDVQQVKMDGIVTESILIIDNNASGFSSGAGHLLDSILMKAHNKLNCPKKCPSSCPNCVLDFDQRFRSDELDRLEALKFLTKEWLDKNKLPSRLAYFEQGSSIEQDALLSALIREYERVAVPKAIQLFVAGDPDDFDLPVSNIRSFTRTLHQKGAAVQIIFEKQSLSNLKNEDLWSLLSLVDLKDVALFTTNSIPSFGRSNAIAALSMGHSSHYWVSEEDGVLTADQQWGQTRNEQYPIVHAVASNDLDISSIDVSDIRNRLEGSSDVELTVWKDLDGPLHTFGEKFWEYLCHHHNELNQSLNESTTTIQRIEYTDRYLFTPLALSQIFRIISHLKTHNDNALWDSQTKIIITTAKTSHTSHPGNSIFHQWKEDSIREEVFKGVFNRLESDFALQLRRKNEIQHGRYLKIHFRDDTTITVRLDQGVGYWWVDNRKHAFDFKRMEETRFEFEQSNKNHPNIENEVRQVLGKNPHLTAQSYPTQIFIKSKI